MAESTGKPEAGSPDNTVPKAVVSRLSLYLRELERLVRGGQATTSSTQLGSTLGCSDAQVRKDLAYFGQFGYPGIGYKCEELIAAIRQILGTDRSWPVALVGLGNLGRALLRYRGCQAQGFRIAAAFDVDPAKIGTEVEGIPVYAMDQIANLVGQSQIRLAIIAVPAASAQAVADELVAAGIDGMLNFAPVTIAVPPEAKVVGVDVAIELEQLSFAVVNRTEKS